MSESNLIREALEGALPLEVAPHGRSLSPEHIYIPPAHVKALRPEASLVVGTRGVGKSVWTAALCAEQTRMALGPSLPDFANTRVYAGYSEAEDIEAYPTADVLSALLADDWDPYDIWRAVMIRRLARELVAEFAVPTEAWQQTLEWLRHNPEALARMVQQAEEQLADQDERLLFVFDALDRTATNWDTMDRLVRGLLRAVLWLKPRARMNAKVFLREDQFERRVADFPDASKLLSTKAELSWERHDLHALLWQHLLNGPGEHGERLRGLYRSVEGQHPESTRYGWRLPASLQRECPGQRALFEALAGAWMGPDKRRGVPYVWSISHLADGHGRTSPRSFLVAIRKAAEDSGARYPDFHLPLHYESIKRGVREASEVRVEEMAEEYAWVKKLMEPLAGLLVPCDFDVIAQHWAETFPEGPEGLPGINLPPAHAEQGWEGVWNDLLRIGIFEQRTDGRIDMPDLYRVGFRLGRKGGVSPRR